MNPARSFRALYNLLLKTHSNGEDDVRREFIVNIILLTSLCFLSILETILIYQYLRPTFGSAQAFSLSVFSIVYIMFISLYILSRRGYFKAAAYGLVILYILATTYAAFSWGPDLYQVVVSYALIITIAGIIIGSRFSIISAVFIGLIITMVNYLDIKGVVHIDRHWKNENLLLNDTIEIGLTYLMIAFISWLSNREIDRSLKRAHRSEETLKKKNESLEQIVEDRTKELKRAQAEKVSQLYRFAEFGRLSSGIFHDLLNPLSAVALNVKELKDQLHPSVASVKEHLDRAVLASQKMDIFMSLVRKQIQTTEINENFSLNNEIKEVLMLLKYRAVKEKTNIQFESSREVKIIGNVLKFHQIMTNLVANALDSYREFEPFAKTPTIKISLGGDDRETEIKVRDYGCGINPAILPKIFDPFFTTKSKHQGIGLGLSTIKEAVEKNFGGRIEVESVLGQGSEFTITIPLNN